MKLISEEGKEGHGMSILPPCQVPIWDPGKWKRKEKAVLPHVSETEISRHYTLLAKRAHGVNDGFYPLGSCTMKYNPKINEQAAALPGFARIHPLQDSASVQGCMKLLADTERMLCEITGMDAMTFQPAAGAHGEFTGLLLIKAWHQSRGDIGRNKIIVPDSAHGTNPASAAMAGFTVVNLPSGPDGCVDLEKLEAALGEDTAGLMLTNPNTVGLFDPHILEITAAVHRAGGLCYYDGANLNAVMGVARPGDMGFDVTHLNLHKTFSAPHGGGGPGSGPVGCKEFLRPYLPGVRPVRQTENGPFVFTREKNSVGDVTAFYGNFLVVVRAYAYLLSLGREGILEAAHNAVLNANYMLHELRGSFHPAYDRSCMHEFVLTLEDLKKETGVSALDFAKALLDHGIHPPTMYFPLIVHEALMIEPTETETKETMDEVIEIFQNVLKEAKQQPSQMAQMPLHTPVRRLDEVTAARHPVVHA